MTGVKRCHGVILNIAVWLVDGMTYGEEWIMNCRDCGMECDFEVILMYGHTEGIEEHTCIACIEE